MHSRAIQLTLTLPAPRRWGGRGARAGRKPNAERAGVSHARRPKLRRPTPAHVTLRVRPDVPSLRSGRLVRAFERSIAEACERGAFRLVHYSLQSDHVHLVIDAMDSDALTRGMKAVGARLARAVNRVFGRRGPVLADRFHLRLLRTPREVRNALRYVLLNARRHARRLTRTVLLDPASSARWFDGWQWRPGAGAGATSVAPVARARSWLLLVGWRRHGLIDPADVPAS